MKSSAECVRLNIVKYHFITIDLWLESNTTQFILGCLSLICRQNWLDRCDFQICTCRSETRFGPSQNRCAAELELHLLHRETSISVQFWMLQSMNTSTVQLHNDRVRSQTIVFGQCYFI